MAASGIGVDRVYVVRLDDLTTAPQATLDAIAGWLGYPPRTHDPTMLIGTPDALGQHAPGIDPTRGTSPRAADAAVRADIDRELLEAGPAIAWIRRLVTGPLAGSPAP